MSAPIKSRKPGLLLVLFLMVIGLAFLAAGRIRFDIALLGYFLLVLSSPILVLLVSDMKQMKGA